MAKIKSSSNNMQVRVFVKSTKGEMLNANISPDLLAGKVPGFAPVLINNTGAEFTADYTVGGAISAKDYFKNNIIDRQRFYIFLKSSINALRNIGKYNMVYDCVLIGLDTVAINVNTGEAIFMYYPGDGFTNKKFFNTFLSDVLNVLHTPKGEDLTYLATLKNILDYPQNMTWDSLEDYAKSIIAMPVQSVPVQPVPVAPMPVPPMPMQPMPQMQMAPQMAPMGGIPVPMPAPAQPVPPMPVPPVSAQPAPQAPVQPVAPMPQAQMAPNNMGRVCIKCGTANSVEGAMFCTNCGTVFEDIVEEKIEETMSEEPVVEKLLIKNGRVVDPVTGRDEVIDILIKDNIIEQIGHNITAENGYEVIDANGLVVAPGLVDTHVHFRDPGFTHKEDIITGAKAAARGGFTTVVCMANTKPAVDNLETLKYIQEKGETTGIHVLQTATVTKELKGSELVDMDALADAGAAGFTDDGIPIMDEKLLVQAMIKAVELDMPISLHEEDPAFIVSPGVNQGAVSEKLGYGGASRTAEDVMVARDCMLALHTGASVCIQHISSKNSVELVRLAKKLGADIHAEATPHHFTLTEDAVLAHGTNARMNPPLRTEEDRLAIIEGIKDGTIDMIVTDHAPHSEEEKAKDLASAPSGITGLETSLGLGIKSLVQTGEISLMKLMALMSKNPSEFYRMVPAGIAEGAPADLVVFGENQLWRVTKEEFASKASNSPFIGWDLPGKVNYTICGGKIVYRA